MLGDFDSIRPYETSETVAIVNDRCVRYSDGSGNDRDWINCEI